MKLPIDNRNKRIKHILIICEQIRLDLLHNNRWSYIKSVASAYISYKNEVIQESTKAEEKYENDIWDHWSKIEGLSIVEATLLSLGIEPRNIQLLSQNEDTSVDWVIRKYFNPDLNKEYQDRKNIFESKFHPSRRIDPLRFIEFCEQKEIKLPKRALKCIRKFNKIIDYKSLFDSAQRELKEFAKDRDRHKDEAAKNLNSKAAQAKEIKNLKISNYLLVKKAFPALQSDSAVATPVTDFFLREGFSLSSETVRKNYRDGETLYKEKNKHS